MGPAGPHVIPLSFSYPFLTFLSLPLISPDLSLSLARPPFLSLLQPSATDAVGGGSLPLLLLRTTTVLLLSLLSRLFPQFITVSCCRHYAWRCRHSGELSPRLVSGPPPVFFSGSGRWLLAVLLALRYPNLTVVASSTPAVEMVGSPATPAGRALPRCCYGGVSRRSPMATTSL